MVIPMAKKNHQCGGNFLLVLVVEYSRYMDLGINCHSRLICSMPRQRFVVRFTFRPLTLVRIAFINIIVMISGQFGNVRFQPDEPSRNCVRQYFEAPRKFIKTLIRVSVWCFLAFVSNVRRFMAD